VKTQSFFLSFLLCLAILGHPRPGFAESSTPEDLLASLQKQGWSEVSPGVMQRSLGGNRVETLGFGAAGLRFQLQEMETHLVDLREEYAQHPSRQLRITIRAHRAQILRVEEALQKATTTDDGLEASAEGLIAQGPGCTVNYDASAFAFPLAPGAASKATAFFNNTCGYTGEVYAHSSSRAAAEDNSVTLNTQSDPALDTPRIGANVSAGASTSANGVKDCYSTAYASVTSYDNDPVLTYAQSDSNYSCVEGLPAPWANTDVGTVGLAGRASYENGVFRLIVGGTDLAGTADAFHFVHQPLTGDGTIVANVAALLKPLGANRTLAGVTFRNDLTAGSAHATMTITSEGEVQFRRRALAGSTTASDGTATTFTPQWLKLVRSGNVFTAYLSANGTAWTQVHTPQTVLMNGTVYVGLVALRNGAGASTGAARFENVSVATPTDPPTTPPTNSLVVRGKGCIGESCSDTDANYSALKIKSAQPNILFDDVAPTSSHDWALLINPLDVNQFSISDFTNGLIPFSVAGGAPDNSLYIAGSGKVGLGTSTPAVRLDVKTNEGGQAAMRLQNSNTGGYSGTEYLGNAGNVNLFFGLDNANATTRMNSVNNHPIVILTNGAERMRITSAGLVGIGTASPSDRFHLFENANANTILRVENPNTGATAAAVFNAKADVAQLNLIAHASTRTISRFGSPLGGWSELLSTTGNGLAIGTSGNTPLVLGTNSTNRMQIGGAGGVTVTGNFTVTGTKNFAVVDPADSQRAIYFTALEGPEAGTYFRGTARLKEGEAVIELPGYFSRVTEPEQLTVQLTLVGHWGQIYVAEKSPERLVIRAAPGTADLEFDFLVQGVRKGYLDYEVERPNTLPR
jgi:hypothetical protein